MFAMGIMWEFDCYRYDMHMLRYNETHEDADAVTIIREGQIYKN